MADGARASGQRAHGKQTINEVDTITLEDHMTGITYIDGSFHASVDGTDITDQFGAIGKDKITAAAGKTQTDGTGFKVTSLQSLVDTYQGKQVTVTYQGKVVNASKANKAINQIILTSNWLPAVIPPDVPTPNPGTDETPVPTYDVDLKKISAADGSKTIQGAKFKIHNDSLNQWYTWDSASNQWTFGTDESKATEFSTDAYCALVSGDADNADGLKQVTIGGAVLAVIALASTGIAIITARRLSVNATEAKRQH